MARIGGKGEVVVENTSTSLTVTGVAHASSEEIGVGGPRMAVKALITGADVTVEKLPLIVKKIKATSSSSSMAGREIDGARQYIPPIMTMLAAVISTNLINTEQAIISHKIIRAAVIKSKIINTEQAIISHKIIRSNSTWAAAAIDRASKEIAMAMAMVRQGTTTPTEDTIINPIMAAITNTSNNSTKTFRVEVSSSGAVGIKIGAAVVAEELSSSSTTKTTVITTNIDDN